ncbi:hypothetical protein C8R43DRAFT_1006328 [Mycena crocata]|nr:hypothetical protein C8R43DRAFT_1006328 [Mycena crocata]
MRKPPRMTLILYFKLYCSGHALPSRQFQTPIQALTTSRPYQSRALPKSIFSSQNPIPNSSHQAVRSYCGYRFKRSFIPHTFFLKFLLFKIKTGAFFVQLKTTRYAVVYT